MNDGIRLDIALVKKGIILTREKAKKLIKNEYVKVNGKTIKKSSTIVFENDLIDVETKYLKYVGRGGYKLEKILDKLNIDLENKICIDIGASTGGFTDCMLQKNANKIYAIDVGRDQLDQSLINNNKVVNMENTNIRKISKKDINDNIDFISIDVSFISLNLVLPVAFELIKDNGEIICLVKPQFEAGIGNIGKNGIVKNKNIHLNVLTQLYQLIIQSGFSVKFCTFSPIKGGKGNIEYLFLINKSDFNINLETLNDVVNQAHKILNNGGV